jgi:hypothetical protein
MQFNNFSKTVSGLTVLFRNIMPIGNVSSFKFYSDDSTGSFSKKEFRWSFDNNYWSSWETLNQGNVTNINTNFNPYTYLEIKYTLTGANSGSVNSFVLNFTENQSTSLLTPSINQQIIINEIDVTNSDLLNNKDDQFYLNRSNHKGTQPLSSVINLQETLDRIMYSQHDTIINTYSVDGSGVGILYDHDGSSLYLKRIFGDASSGIIITENSQGIITITNSFNVVKDQSINDLYEIKLNESSLGQQFYFDASGFLDVSIATTDITKTYVDSSLNERDTSISWLNNNKQSQGNYINDASNGVGL